MIIRAKLYDLVALAFAVFAVILFIVFYVRYADGDLMAFIRNPFLLLMMIFPFFPAYVFAWMAKRKRSALYDIAYVQPEQDKRSAKKV